MAAPNPVDSALEAYRAKLVKANTGEVEKKFRKAFPDATGEQITALGRQGMLQKLMEQKKAELAKLAAPAVAPIVAADPMAQLLQMMLAQQKEAEEQRKAERAERLAAEEKRLAAESRCSKGR